jgi:hypothetical protein
MSQTKFDVIMKVKLCPVHKKKYEKVWVKIGTKKNGKPEYGGHPQSLMDVWHHAENCNDCIWRTLFPTLEEKE